MSLRPSITRPARQSTANLAAIGAQNGPSAALGAFLQDMAGSMISQAQDAQAEQVATQAYAEGASQGSQAAQDGAAPVLPADDSTVRNRALKQGAMAGWLARFDVDSQAKAETWAAEHADDPAAFQAKWDGLTSGTVAMMPADLQPQVRAELDKRGGQTLSRLQADKLQKDRAALEDRQNASILEGQLLAARNSENSWRAGDVASAQENDAKYLAYLDSRTDLDARHKVVEREKFRQTTQRAAVLGEFDRVKTRGLGAAERFIQDFRKPGRHPQLDPDAVESIAAEMERHTADLRQQRSMAVAELRDQAQDAIFRAERGYGTVNMDALAAKARALGASDLAKTLSEASRHATLASDLARLPLPELQARVAELTDIAKTSSDDSAARRAELGKAVLARPLSKAVTDLRDQAQDAIFRVKHGYGAGNIDDLAATARSLGEDHLAQKLTEVSSDVHMAGDLGKLPLPDLQARVAALDADAMKATDNDAARRAELAKRVLSNAQAGLKADALEHFRAQGAAIPAIDWDKPDTLAARAKAADHHAGINRIFVPVLTKAETADLAARIEQAGYEDRAKLLGNLYQGLGRSRYPEVLDAIKQTAPEAAQAGALMAQGPDGAKAARDILFGADLRRTVAKDGAAGGRQFMPPKDAVFTSAFQREVPPDAVAGLSPENLDGVQKAIIAAYVAKSHAAGKASQDTLDAKLFRQSVDAVTGGVLKWNGQSLIAPVRGMTQDQFDDFMDGLTDADLYGAQSMDGHPVNAVQLREFGTLRMHTPGRYLAFINGQTVFRGGQPLLLDIAGLAGGR